VTVLPKDSKWTGQVDSRGFRILTDQVVDVQQMTEEQVLLMLKDSIIHEDGICMLYMSSVKLRIDNCLTKIDNYLMVVIMIMILSK